MIPVVMCTWLMGWTLVLVGPRKEDTTGSGYKQNTIGWARPAPPKDSGSCFTLLAMLWCSNPVHEYNESMSTPERC